MFLLVRFLRDEKFDILHVRDVLNFNLEKYKKNNNRKFKAKWLDGKIYEAVVIHVAASKEVLEKKIEANGRRLYSIKGLISNTETEDEATNFPKSREIQNIDTASSTSKLPIYEIQSPTEERSDMSDIGKLNICIGELKEMVDSLKIENDTLKALNFKLQNEVIDKFQSSTNIIQNNPPAEAKEVGDVYEDKVYIGYETFVDKGHFDYILAHSKSGQAFVKQLAVAVYGTCVLMKSSVTGQACKNKKNSIPKPLDALKLSAIKEAYKFYLKRTGTSAFVIDLEVQKVSIYISRKIVDLSRGPRKSKLEKALNQDELSSADVSHPVEVNNPVEEASDDDEDDN